MTDAAPAVSPLDERYGTRTSALPFVGRAAAGGTMLGLVGAAVFFGVEAVTAADGSWLVIALWSVVPVALLGALAGVLPALVGLLAGGRDRRERLAVAGGITAAVEVLVLLAVPSGFPQPPPPPVLLIALASGVIGAVLLVRMRDRPLRALLRRAPTRRTPPDTPGRPPRLHP